MVTFVDDKIYNRKSGQRIDNQTEGCFPRKVNFPRWSEPKEIYNTV